MRKVLMFLLLIFSFQSISLAQEVSTIFSKVLNEDRDVFISTPDNYKESQEEYPVLYVLDGGAYFKLSLSIVDYLSGNGKIPPMIVVAIPNTDRNRDFTPTADKIRPEGGGADNFITFLEEELIPYVDENYRTGSYKVLFGYSLCGMFSVYTLFSKPYLFDGYIASSPYLMHDNNYTEKFANEKIDKKIKLNNCLYMSIGSNELGYLETLNRFTKKLKDEDVEKLRWKYGILENEDHGSVQLLSIYNGLRLVFADWQQIKYESISNIADIKRHYELLSKKYGCRAQISEILLTTLGYRFMGSGKLDLALECFMLNIEYYPNSANAYDSYGEALELNKQLLLAKKNYEKACELGEKNNDPQLQVFREHLEDLTKILE